MKEQGSLRQRLDDQGFVILHNIHNTHLLTKTIGVLGTLVPQYDGELIWDVRQDETKRQAFNTKSTGPIGPHTEFFEFVGQPPKYLVLQCIIPAQSGGATLLADSRTIFAHLSQTDINDLRGLQFEYYSSELNSNGLPKHVALHHPLEIDANSALSIFRFSTKYMGGDSFPKFSDLHKRIIDLFYTFAERVVWGSGDVLIWDNHRFLHAREAFNDSNRHLRRVVISQNALDGE